MAYYPELRDGKENEALKSEIESLRAYLALQNERIKDYEAEIEHYRAMLSTRI